MRSGDCGVEVIGVEGGSLRETSSGHVLAHAGQVYALRLRNHGPLRALFDVQLDGRLVTAGGLVVEALAFVDLERPIHATERGRFTVVAEGDEVVFGPDGGRDNPELGLIEVRFRRELPARAARPIPLPWPAITLPDRRPSPPAPVAPPAPPGTPPEWTPPAAARRQARDAVGGALMAGASTPELGRSPATSSERPTAAPSADAVATDAVERAAGTGLTGQSAQEFRPTTIGELEAEATVVRLRLVIARPSALDTPRPLPGPAPDDAPARPAPRP